MFICVKSFFLRPSRRITGNSFRGSSITLTAISAPTGATVAVVRCMVIGSNTSSPRSVPASAACSRLPNQAADLASGPYPQSGFST